MEALTKEVLFDNGLPDEELEQMDFGGPINECRRRQPLTDDELEFLDEKRRDLRNPYLHFDQTRLTKDILVPAWTVPIERLKEMLEKVKRGVISEEEARKELEKGMRPVFWILKSSDRYLMS